MKTILDILRLTKGHKRLDFTDVLSYVYLSLWCFHHVRTGFVAGSLFFQDIR